MECGAAQLCQPWTGQSISEPTAPEGNSQLYGPTNSPADGPTSSPADGPTNSPADGPTGSPVEPAYISGTAGTTPWWRDPRVALAVKCDSPPVVWGTCSLYNIPNDITISVPFLIDTGADVTVIPEANWPPHWKLEKAPMVGGVGGVSRAWRSTQLVAITLYTEKGPEKTITLFPYVLSCTIPLLGRDALALLKVKVTNLS